MDGQRQQVGEEGAPQLGGGAAPRHPPPLRNPAERNQDHSFVATIQVTEQGKCWFFLQDDLRTKKLCSPAYYVNQYRLTHIIMRYHFQRGAGHGYRDNTDCALLACLGPVLKRRAGHGNRARPSRLPEKPLRMWMYEASPFVKVWGVNKACRG